MYPAIIDVVPKNDYLLSVEFDNGEKGVLDMKPFLTVGVFKKISQFTAFKKVRVSFDTIEWDSGVDLDPEFVYSQCFNK